MRAHSQRRLGPRRPQGEARRRHRQRCALLSRSLESVRGTSLTLSSLAGIGGGGLGGGFGLGGGLVGISGGGLDGISGGGLNGALLSLSLASTRCSCAETDLERLSPAGIGGFDGAGSLDSANFLDGGFGDYDQGLGGSFGGSSLGTSSLGGGIGGGSFVGGGGFN